MELTELQKDSLIKFIKEAFIDEEVSTDITVFLSRVVHCLEHSFNYNDLLITNKIIDLVCDEIAKRYALIKLADINQKSEV